MAQKAEKNLLDALELLKNYSEDGYKKVLEDEDLIDKYEDRLGTYLLRLNSRELNRTAGELVTEYLHNISDFERISDHAVNIAETAQEMHTKQISFSEEADTELDTLLAAVREILETSVDNFISGNEQGQYAIEPLEERIDVLCDEMKLRHVERMKNGKCSMNIGFVFNDILSNLERVSDHCSNIAVAMIEINGDMFDTHGYLDELKKHHTADFDRMYAEYAGKYSI